LKVNSPGIYTVELRDALYPASASVISNVEVMASSNPLPVGIRAENISQATAKIEWNSLQNIYRYQIRFKKTDDQNWEYHNVMAPKNSFTLKNLHPGVKYEYQLMTYASAKSADSSGWSSYKEFTTLADCIEVVGLKAKATSYEAVCSWKNNFFALKQYVMIREQGNSNWKYNYPVGSAVNSVRIPNLNPGKKYEWCVKCVCKNATEKYTLSSINIFSTMALAGIAAK
jgi:hypothetical protein